MGVDNSSVVPEVDLAWYRQRVPTRYKVGILALLLIGVAPAAMTPLELSRLVAPLYLMMFAISWDLVSGYTGQVSFGPTLFFGLSAYTTTVLNLQHGVPPYLSIPIGVGVAMLGGLLIGVPALRIRGPFLSLVTLIAPIILYQLIILFSNNLPVLAPQGLGGSSGFGIANDPLVGSASPTTDPLVLVESFRTTVLVEYYLAFFALLFTLAVTLVVTRTATGDVFEAIREDEDVVRAVGLSGAKFKIFAFVLSAALGGLAAAMFVHTNSAGNPLQPSQVVTVQVAIQVIVMAVIGGMGTIVGAAVGAAFFGVSAMVFTQLSNFITIPIIGMTPAELFPVPIFVLAVLVLLFEPGGLVRLGINTGERIRARIRGERASIRDSETPLEQTVRSYLEAFRRE